MGSLGQGLGPMDKPESRCFLPGGHVRTSSSKIQSIPIFAGGKCGIETDIDHDRLSKAVHLAWAQSLSIYLTRATVSFECISIFQNTRQISEPVAASVCDIVDASLEHYQLSNENHLELKGSSFVYPLKWQDGDRTCNTAILEDHRKHDGSDQANVTGLRYRLDGIIREFDLVIHVAMVAGNSSISLIYRSAEFPTAYSERIAKTTKYMLTFLHGGKTTGPKGQQLLSKEDEATLRLWNKAPPRPQLKCIHSAVSAKAAEIPEAEAVCAWDGSLSYAQLDALSTRVASYLVSSGVAVGDFIPFLFEKSMWTVVATLAILKAGAAFVPLDPSHPKARLEEILSSTRAKVVVTSNALKSRFEGLDIRAIALCRATCNSLSQHYGELPVVLASQPVFALFTSGSTGKPKGMVHTHGAIYTYFLTHGQLMGYERARMLQFSSYTFDAAILDIFTTLIFGGCVCVPSEDDRISNITGAVNEMDVDFALLTPTFASLFAPSDTPGLRNLCVAGEPLTQAVIDRWAGKVRLMNGYGPAETGICFLKDVDRETRAENIGYPLLNCSCWLVDPDNCNKLVPVGAVGELVVASPSLAREYLNDPAKTDLSFITGMAWQCSMGLDNCTFFKTGDLLRYNVDAMDGSCYFVRRKDTQIKLHGQRIESGDVESRLLDLPEIAVAILVQPKEGCFADELVVVLQLFASTAPRYSSQPLSLDQHSSLDIDFVKQYLERHLPPYMVPPRYLAVESMLVNPSGKIDRKGILTWVSCLKTQPFILPENLERRSTVCPLNKEEVTAHILSKKIADLIALKDEARGLLLPGHDFNLLEVGVNSIQMIQLLMFLRTLDAQFSAKKLWNSRTRIRDLARAVDFGNSESNDLDPSDFDSLQEYRTFEDTMLKELQDIRLKSAAPHEPNVLITGASGFLGLRILKHILTSTSCHIFALVRCVSHSDGLSRLMSSACRQGWWCDSYNNRLEVWPGDLRKPDFALSESHLKILRGLHDERLCVNVIIHNAAWINYNLDFDALKSANTEPLLALLKITAGSQRISRFVYVSGGTNPTVGKFNLQKGAEISNRTNGYGQTKFVAEALVYKCAEHAAFHNKTVNVLKPGYIVSSVSGDDPNNADFLWRLLATALKMKAYTTNDDHKWLFVSDVDYIAEKASELALTNESTSKGLNVLDGMLVSDLWIMLRDRFGYCLKPLSKEQWRRKLEADVLHGGEGHVLFPFVHKLRGDDLNIGEEVDRSHLPSNQRVKQVIEWNVQRLIDTGYFPASWTT